MDDDDDDIQEGVDRKSHGKPASLTAASGSSGMGPPSSLSLHLAQGIDKSSVSDNDVLSGRGGGTNLHPGNRYYRDLVFMNRHVYDEASKAHKPNIARKIVQLVRERGGRFLRKDKADDGRYHEIGDDAAREKTSQALRHRTFEMRKHHHGPRSVFPSSAAVEPSEATRGGDDGSSSSGISDGTGIVQRERHPAQRQSQPRTQTSPQIQSDLQDSSVLILQQLPPALISSRSHENIGSVLQLPQQHLSNIGLDTLPVHLDRFGAINESIFRLSTDPSLQGSLMNTVGTGILDHISTDVTSSYELLRVQQHQEAVLAAQSNQEHEIWMREELARQNNNLLLSLQQSQQQELLLLFPNNNSTILSQSFIGTSPIDRRIAQLQRELHIMRMNSTNL